jgi:LPXTG-motif cell wall-anchored protein
MGFMQETWFLVFMALALVGLIGLLVVLRNKRTDD